MSNKRGTTGPCHVYLAPGNEEEDIYENSDSESDELYENDKNKGASANPCRASPYRPNGQKTAPAARDFKSKTQGTTSPAKKLNQNNPEASEDYKPPRPLRLDEPGATQQVRGRGIT